jgi:DNA-binding CsgD family transcriptional regulator/tetratricopeptide (TPR) repeat protein
MVRLPYVGVCSTERVDGRLFGWWAGRMAESVGFVGRDSELSRLQAAVSGDVRLLLVIGDAGVGKTRFVTESMRRMAADGTVAIWGGCLPMRETLPLLPLADALGDLSRVDRRAVLESALATAPRYVREEVARLLPELASETTEAAGPEGGQRDRLFAAIADLFETVSQRRRIVLVVEDVHWADAATLDCLTFLTRAHRDPAVPVVVTCRSDEAPLDPQVVEWLAHVRERGGVTQIGLGPMSRREVAEHVAELSGSPAPPLVVDELYARAEGNPFFTEQLMAAAAQEGGLGSGVGLPTRLAELLVTRAARCGGAARTVLSGLAVAGRPLDEDLLAAVSALGVDDVRGGLRELAAARLLADTGSRGEHRPRHALLAEAVAAQLLPGERVALHERVAGALQAAGDDTFAAEAAGHWAAAGRVAEELPARVHAAEAAERVLGYAEAARHWQRAIELCALVPNPEPPAGADLPHMYIRGVNALFKAGEPADGLAEEAHHRFADHPDPAIAAPIHLLASYSRGATDPPASMRAVQQALRLFEQLPPSVDKAKAWRHLGLLLVFGQGPGDARRAAFTRGLEVAEAAGAPGVAAYMQMHLAHEACLHGRVAEGLELAQRARARADVSGDLEALVEVTATESEILLKVGRFDDAAQSGLRGLQAARESGHHKGHIASLAVGNTAAALLAQARTVEAAELIDPLTDEPVSHDQWRPQLFRAEIDLLRGDVAAAAERVQQVKSLMDREASIDRAREVTQRAAEVALWAGQPEDGLADVREALARHQTAEWTMQCGWLLVIGMRACADLAAQARARRDEPTTHAALAAAGGLIAWVDEMGGTPFTDHPCVATIPAERATWNAERSRLAGMGDPTVWQAAADAWGALGCPHRAAYAGWRHAEARLLAGEPPAAVASTLRQAAATADGHVPLQTAIHALADRARIPLDTAASAEAEPSEAAVPYGLTEREVLVLRLLVAGRSNGEIGAELFISRKTASVHVSNILRKLGVSNRAQAAALAERACMLDAP